MRLALAGEKQCLFAPILSRRDMVMRHITLLADGLSRDCSLGSPFTSQLPTAIPLPAFTPNDTPHLLP